MGIGRGSLGRVLRYRSLWWTMLLLIAVPAIVLGIFESLVPIAVTAVSVVGFCIGAVLVDENLCSPSWGEAALAPALVAAGAPAFGRGTLPLMLTAAATSPPVVRAVLFRAGVTARPGREDRPSHDTADMTACLSAMSGAELCELWGRSFALVKSGANVSQRIVGAGLRASVLDELERRDQSRFAAWLSRHPCPASTPRWVTGTGPGSPT